MSGRLREPAYQHNGRTVNAAQFYAIACDPRRNVAVEACAGAGKTWMLVSRIVRALLEDERPDGGARPLSPHEILAITFTKRAAGEMRERLLLWLRQFAHASDAELWHELRIRGITLPDNDAALQAKVQRLRGLYRSLLRTGRPVQIRTFHSWFAALLRAAPISVLQQLQLPVNYELLEDDKEAVRLVWRRFYQALLERPSCKADFEAVVSQHGRSNTEKALGVALDKRIEFRLADAAKVVDTSVQHFSVLFPALLSSDAPACDLMTHAARIRWMARARSLGQEGNQTPRRVAALVLEAFRERESPGSDPLERLAQLRKAFFVAHEDRLTQHLRNYPAAQEAEAELLVVCRASHQHAAWLYQQRMARLTRVLLAEFAALKRERGWVDMTDVEQAALVLLSDPVLSGWVQERLDTRVRHLLIDEFQDTNPLQWQALLSWLGSYAGARGHAPSLFLVGDPKQSIYRFRRAEPQVFIAAQQFVAKGLEGDLLSCDHTRRNAQEVVDTVNSVMVAASVDGGYEGFREHTTDSRDAGLVCTLPPVPRPATAQRARADGWPTLRQAAWRDSLTTPREVPEETLHLREARQVAAWIASRIQGGLLPEHVMVLSRRRAGLLPLQLELRALRIAAQIGEKTDLIDCCEVLDLVALLDALVSPHHDLSLARALRSPLFGVSDQSLVVLALQQRVERQPWFELLRRGVGLGEELAHVGARLLRWQAWLAQLPPHDALQAIYGDGQVLARFAMAVPSTQRDAVLANLRALLTAALQISGGRYATPYAFVRVLKARGVQAPAAVDDHAVRLLTIHGAKGLEADTVVLLDTHTPARASETMGVLVDWPGHAAHPHKFVFMASEARPPACAETTLAHERGQRKREELNALYVALTRARATLVVSSITPHRESPDSWWQRLGPWITQQLAVPPLKPATPSLGDSASASFDFKELPVLPQNFAPPVPVDASSEDATAPGTSEDTPESLVGKAMHRLLEWGDASDANAAAAAREFGLDGVQQALAGGIAARILAGEGAWAWDSTVVGWQGTEVELMYQGETLRLDRLVQRRDTGHWWVLDYKSAHAPQVQPALIEQLRSYRDAVQAIYPDATVRAAFLTGHGNLVEPEPEPQ